MLLWPASFTLPNALRAAGDVRYTMTVSLFSIWAFRSVMFLVRFVRGKWKEKKVI